MATPTETKGKPIIRKRPIIGRSHAAGVDAAQKGRPSSVRPLGVVFVSSKAPFMSVVNRAVKTLDRGPGGARWSSTKVAPLLADRIAKTQAKAVDALPTAMAQGSDWKTARQREVLLLATGHAISKLVLIAGWFQRQRGYVVTVRTRWAATVDDIFTFEGGSGNTRQAEQAEQSEQADQVEAADELQDGADATDIDAEKVENAEKAENNAAHRELRKSTRVRTISCLEVAVRLK